MANPKAGYFCIYNSTAIDDDALVDSLNRGQFNNPPSEKQWSTPQVQFSGQEPSAIVAHHRQSPGILDNQYFVICDRPDWATSSVLAVNLDFQGWEDAARMEVGVAGDALPSISIANTDWEENLGASGETWPRERFAVYVTSEGTIDQEALVKVLNAGLNGRKAWTMGGGVCRDATALLPKIGGTELTALAEMHESIARGEGFDPATFVVADHADWESAGVSIVQTGGQNLDVCNKLARGSTFREPHATGTGELWLHLLVLDKDRDLALFRIDETQDKGAKYLETAVELERLVPAKDLDFTTGFQDRKVFTVGYNQGGSNDADEHHKCQLLRCREVNVNAGEASQAVRPYGWSQ
ncbi:MAG: hypothetical protein ASARMPRED_000882 [Alectoria sarmentosa]|nr:MAG: hypothetical protein ASARMPRED_000882 [Alectoria sarmentosa]